MLRREPKSFRAWWRFPPGAQVPDAVSESTPRGLNNGVTPKSYTERMPSKHPRIAVTADPQLGEALARVRAATGTREPDATLLRRLAVGGAEVELEAGRNRRAAAEALFEAMDEEQFDLDPAAIDRLNETTPG